MNEPKNSYLEEVIAQQQVVDRELKRKAAPVRSVMAAGGRQAPETAAPTALKTTLPGVVASDGGRAVLAKSSG